MDSIEKRNCSVGSGAIESAHREVIQHRLKRSGQRWSKTGAQQIAQLRVAKKSNRWNKIINMVRLQPDLEKFHAPERSENLKMST